MAAVSTCRRLVSIDLPRRNPCWRGKIQPARWVSHLLRAAEATMRLSQLTILSGGVLFGEYALVPSSVVVVLFCWEADKCAVVISVSEGGDVVLICVVEVVLCFVSVQAGSPLIENEYSQRSQGSPSSEWDPIRSGR